MIAGIPDPGYFGRTKETVPTMIVSTGAPLSKAFLISIICPKSKIIKRKKSRFFICRIIVC